MKNKLEYFKLFLNCLDYLNFKKKDSFLGKEDRR